MHLADELIAYGHINLRGTHQTAIEITTEDFLTHRGNCIIGIKSPKGVSNLSTELKNAIHDEKRILVELLAGPFSDSFSGYGHKDLPLSNPISMVFRQSSFISDRTILIKCSKNSYNLDRNLINYLQDSHHELHVKFYYAE